MPVEALAFVQFIHPGHEHGPDAGEFKSWNRGSHRRKFLLANGTYLLGGERQQGRIAFWGEWEPPSRVIARYPASGDLPRFVHEPILERPESFHGLQNTDPYVFGDRFLYTGCQQHTNRGATETQLRRLTRGSVILFGSCRDLSRFVVDTVFVVADYVDHSFRNHVEALRGVVADPYWTVTLGPWYAEGGDAMSFRLYLGATPEDPVEGMFSFVPCVPAEDADDSRFPRPEVRLDDRVTPQLKQGKKFTRLAGPDEAATLWTQVVEQVADGQDLALGTRLEPPRIQDNASSPRRRDGTDSQAMRVYVVTDPPSIHGIYDTWAECQAAVAGVPGARYQAVATRKKAEAMLQGPGVVLSPGTYAFTDGNAAGGVGIVLVEQGPDDARSVCETSTSVDEVFRGGGVPGLESAPAVVEALRELRNVLAELAGLYHVLRQAPPMSAFTIVDDYEGVAAWIEGRWKTRDPVVAAVVDACRGLLQERRLTVAFQHQHGHQSTWAGRDDFAYWNARADALASQGAAASP